MIDNSQNKKLFTLGSITCLILGILIYGYFIWMFPLFRNNTLMVDYYQEFIELFIIILLSSFTTAILVYKNSLINFQNHHVARAILFGLGNLIGWTIYSAELQERNKKPVKNSFLYGTIAIILFILMIIFIFWYNTKI